MINYLKSMRRKYSNENNTLKYLKYACGEILLVAFGILVALSIDNWNETRKENELEIVYYCKIKEDLEVDRNKLSSISEAVVTRQKVSKRLLLNLHSTPEDKRVIMSDYLAAVRSDTFFPSKAAISDLISSGKLALIQNETLKKNVLQYYTDMDNSLKIIRSNREEVTNRIFGYPNILEMGIHQTFYRGDYGEDLVALLPDVNWQTDKNNPYFKKFEEHIGIAIVVNAREKQIVGDIIAKIDSLLTPLNEACKV